MNRRNFIQNVALGAGAVALVGKLGEQEAEAQEVQVPVPLLLDCRSQPDSDYRVEIKIQGTYKNQELKRYLTNNDDASIWASYLDLVTRLHDLEENSSFATDLVSDRAIVQHTLVFYVKEKSPVVEIFERNFKAKPVHPDMVMCEVHIFDPWRQGSVIKMRNDLTPEESETLAAEIKKAVQNPTFTIVDKFAVDHRQHWNVRQVYPQLKWRMELTSGSFGYE